ncbi:HMG (high mobility group) box protein withARID/BRIGHT DNA-binding domain, partial [Striga asiatica]
MLQATSNENPPWRSRKVLTRTTYIQQSHGFSGVGNFFGSSLTSSILNAEALTPSSTGTMISRAWTSTSKAGPLILPSGWWIIIRVLGIANRLPFVPPARIMEAVDADEPSAIVETSDRTRRKTSKMAIVELPDILVRILSIQQKHLADNGVGDEIINLVPQEHDSLLQQQPYDVSIAANGSERRLSRGGGDVGKEVSRRRRGEGLVAEGS